MRAIRYINAGQAQADIRAALRDAPGAQLLEPSRSQR
jgi:hypothetical protein